VQRLLLLGGPPGVGKTTVAPLLAERLQPCAWVDGDDLWRMSPTRITDRARRMVESNIVHVLREFLHVGYENVFLCWVLHRREIVERILRAVSPDRCTVSVIHLVATPEILRTRIESNALVGRSLETAHDRLALIQSLPYERVDTSAATPAEVADRVAAVVLGTSSPSDHSP
jgi:gluconate kinase